MNSKTFCATLAVAFIMAFATGASALAPPGLRQNHAPSTAPDNVANHQALADENVATPTEVGNIANATDATFGLILAGNNDAATADPPNVATLNTIANALKRDQGFGLANKDNILMGAPPDVVMNHPNGSSGFRGTGVTNGGHNQGGEDDAANDEADDDTGCVNTAPVRWTIPHFTPRN